MSLVFNATAVTIFQEELLQLQGLEYTGWDMFAIFGRNRRLSRKWYETGPRLL